MAIGDCSDLKLSVLLFQSHRALNKDDRSFDKYYVINYLEIGKRWTHLAREAEIEDEEDEWTETPNLPEELYWQGFSVNLFLAIKNNIDYII